MNLFFAKYTSIRRSLCILYSFSLALKLQQEHDAFESKNNSAND
ncbi:hypothetical protein L950_0208235 [Sphingobacterium sp. IITKGP-BTPF85]|nr:hypothetical protein L950_0208235 [Sphingobacterium sp. IITKGP-BTPF85]